MEQNQLMVVDSAEQKAMAQRVANACKDIVEKTALDIEGRKYVRVEGWQAIANGFGCSGSSRDVVEVVDTDGTFRGFKAIGEVRRNSDGALIAQAEGFVGVDEVRWFGGEAMVWDRETRQKVRKEFKPAPEYSRRGMAQTRAISRACRSAFAFIVVMINENLDTTPAEEADDIGDGAAAREKVVRGRDEAAQAPGKTGNGKPWPDVVCSYGRKDGPLRGRRLGDLSPANLKFLYDKFSDMDPSRIEAKDKEMVDALIAWESEAGHQ